MSVLDIVLDDFSGSVVQGVLILTHHVIIVYSAYWALSKSSIDSAKQIAVSACYITLSGVLFFASGFFYNGLIQKLFKDDDTPDTGMHPFAIGGFSWDLQFVVIGIVLFLSERLVVREKQLRFTSEENLKIEADNLRLELKKKELEMRNDQLYATLLRAQVNPHFLVNALNSIYAQSLTGTAQQVSDALLTLSEMMRYSLTLPQNIFSTISLLHEWQHVHHYLKMQQLRFSGKLQVCISKEGKISACTILPFVIVTLVENAFKYGDLQDPDHPLILQLKVCDEEKVLHFNTRNKINRGLSKDLSNGVGLANVRSRLEVVYGNRFELTTESLGDSFTAILKIPMLMEYET